MRNNTYDSIHNYGRTNTCAAANQFQIQTSCYFSIGLTRTRAAAYTNTSMDGLIANA